MQRRSLGFLIVVFQLFFVVTAVAEDGTPAPETDVTPKSVAEVRFHRPLQEPITSFGAAIQDGYLYVFSGHDGEAHGFGKDQVSNHFRRIKFDEPTAQWEDLAMHDPAQSVALVSDGTYIYRVGGLTFNNDSTAERADFKSTDYFARYDVAADKWEELTPLPAPRSSLDAAVVGRKVFVAGGWNLQGEGSDNAQWRDDILSFDLDNPAKGWITHPGPGYITRAVSTAAYNGKFYLFGGIKKRGITRKVSVFDPATEQWSEGPELPADHRMSGFATSSFATGGNLYVTGYSGVVYMLGGNESRWVQCGRLMYPRFFLRLLPVNATRLLALGGSSPITGRTASVESFDLVNEADMQMTSWSVEFGGKAKHSQSLVYANKKLYAFGGNASRGPHDFSKEAFVDEAYAFDIETRSVRELAKMPSPLQSAVAMRNRLTSEHSQLVLAGGLGIGEDGEFGSLDTVLAFDPDNESWSTVPTSLPSPRAMFDGFYHNDAVWMIGGSDAGHGGGLDDSIVHWWGDETDAVVLPDLKLPTPRRSFGGVVVKDHYYAIGGLDQGIVESMDVLDLESREWTSGPSPKIDRVFPTVCAIGDKIYLYGGFAKKDGHFAAATALEVFDTESKKWSVLSNAIEGISSSMQMMAVGDRLMFYGVDNEQDGVANFVLLDPDRNFVPPKAEGMSFSGRRGGGSDDDVKRMMRRDENRDGKLSASELGSRLGGLLTDGDTDGDSLLNRSELKSLLEADSE